MPRELFSPMPEKAEIRDYSLAPLQPTEVRIKVEFGAIKHGTEFLHFSGKAPFANMEFDGEQRMFVAGKAAERSWSCRIGNIVVGTVIETGSGVSRFHAGDRVYCHGGLREVATNDESRVRPLIAPLQAIDAVCTDPAYYAFGAVRDAQVAVGDTVAVFGLGAIGLFAVQFLKLCGCTDIVAFDPIAKRRALAESFGATQTFDPTQVEPGETIRSRFRRGVDAAIEISGSYRALHSAMRCVGMCGKVVTVGFYKGDTSPINLGMEWHHNRLQLISSMPDWGNPLRDHPQWDGARMRETIVRLFAEKKLTSSGIVDPIVSFDSAADAYLRIYRNPNESVKLGVRFGD